MTEPPQQPPTPPPRRLYWMSGAPSSWRVLLALELKHLPYEAIRLDASQGETHTEEFLRVNPRGQVPVLIDHEKGGGVAIYESFAILMFLEKHYRQIPLLAPPQEPALYAHAITRACECENFHRSMLDLYRCLKKVNGGAPLGGACRGLIEQKRNSLMKEILLWEGTYLADGATYVCGCRVGLADISLFPMVAFAVRQGLQLDAFPRFSRFYHCMQALPEVQRTWPPHWKEQGATAVMDPAWLQSIAPLDAAAQAQAQAQSQTQAVAAQAQAQAMHT